MDLFSLGALRPNVSILSSPPDSSLDNHDDVIRLIQAAIVFKVPIFPLTWKPALDALGEGATGYINQSPMNSKLSFAFKRFNRANPYPGLSDAEYRTRQYDAMISEMKALSHPDIYNHPNVVNVEGLCWEPVPELEVFWPVLVFRKAEAGNLSRFLASPEAATMDSDDLLLLCGEIAKALSIMHRCGVVHGDIKPANILVSKGPNPEDFGIKVTDFGYSCFGTNDDDLVLVPRTRPWEAPEWHDRPHKVKDAQRMDVYSFGLLCLWIFCRQRSFPSPDFEGVTIARIFSDPTRFSEQLKVAKSNGSLLHDVLWLAEDMFGSNETAASVLQQLFKLSLAPSTIEREQEMTAFVQLLCEDDVLSEIDRTGNVQEFNAPSWHGTLKLSSIYFDMEACDFRLHQYFFRQLARAANGQGCSICVKNAGLQLALCYEIGFGVKSSKEEAENWSERSGQGAKMLAEALRTIKETQPSTNVMQQLINLGYLTQLPEEYENEGILRKAVKVYQNMVTSRERALGPTHSSTRRLRGLLSDILNRNDQLEEAAALLRAEIRISEDRNEQEELPILRTKLARTYEDLGQLDQSESLRQQILDGYIADSQQTGNMRVVARFYLTQIKLELCKYDEAVEQGLLAVEESVIALGPYHSNTLFAKSILARAYFARGDVRLAIDWNEQVAKGREESIGPDHPDTIESVHRLGLQYNQVEDFDQAARCFERVARVRGARLSENAEPAITAVNNHAAVLSKVGQAERAARMQEALLAQIEPALGPQHRLTISVMANLGASYEYLRHWDKAEPLERAVLRDQLEKLGLADPLTLRAMHNLITTLFAQSKWDEAWDISLQELEAREGASDKPDSAKVAAIFVVSRSLSNLARWAEAVGYLEKELLWRGELELANQPHEHIQAFVLLAIAFMKLERWEDARKKIAMFLDTFQQVPPLSAIVAQDVQQLAGLCDNRGWQGEAQRLLELPLASQRTEHSMTDAERTKDIIEKLAGL